MKLLLDENLSPMLVASIGDLYPGSRHVEDCGLASASDDEIWQYASQKWICNYLEGFRFL